jgi:hypothetical protein
MNIILVNNTTNETVELFVSDRTGLRAVTSKIAELGWDESEVMVSADYRTNTDVHIPWDVL